jgi:membrane-bound metal-dependent hydrolase YbcI (DUF457 family)
MAMFRHHVSLGAVISTAVTVVVYSYGLIVDPWDLGVLFAICAFASMLPDFDSDSGLPFYLIFGATTLAVTGYVLYHALHDYPSNYYVLIGLPLAALIGYWSIVGKFVKRITQHRGIWHSFPMLAVWSLGTFLLALYLGVEETTAILYGASMAAGFLSHLYLDEIWANVDQDGNPFTYKKSLGTAMKFFSASKSTNIAMYFLIAVFAYLSIQASTFI